jgi:hypothetical protein
LQVSSDSNIVDSHTLTSEWQKWTAGYTPSTNILVVIVCKRTLI